MENEDTIYDYVFHVNHGFQHEEQWPPPFPPTIPRIPVPQNPQFLHPNPSPTYASERYSAQSLHQYAPQTAPVNTFNTTTPGLQRDARLVHKASRRKKWLYTIVTVIILVIPGVIFGALWSYVPKGVSKCLQGQLCKADNKCISYSQWCDGVPDCPSGEDEAHCFRLHGSNFLLQMYSNVSRKWVNVCSDGWNDDLGIKACEDIGYERNTYVSYEEIYSRASLDYVVVKADSLSSSNMNMSTQGFLSKSSDCPSNKFVALKCIECGRSSRSRIVGGSTVTSKGVWPWQVSLQASKKHLCGGSIITPYWIVTAAHCVHEISNAKDWTVYAGYLTRSEMRSATSSVSRIVRHNFDPENMENDIALMKLTRPLTITLNVRPVCLPNKGMYFSAPQECYITGWGKLSEGGPPSETLQEAKIQLIDRTTCNKPGVYAGKITDTMICAGKLQGGVDSCQGDSGGPLVTKENSLWWLVGDTSWGKGCALRNQPGVYGNVTYFLDWIYEQMRRY